EIATADREIGRLLAALGSSRLADTVVVAAGDHGEAFGEHGEYAHSIFVYDTTLRVPFVMRVPSAASSAIGRVVSEPVTLADVAPTAARLLGFELKDVDGIDLGPALEGRHLAGRELYAESFAPLVEFGWAPLRAIRSGPWKFVAAPKPELYDLERDPGEQSDVATARDTAAQSLAVRASRYSSHALPARGAQP